MHVRSCLLNTWRMDLATFTPLKLMSLVLILQDQEKVKTCSTNSSLKTNSVLAEKMLKSSSHQVIGFVYSGLIWFNHFVCLGVSSSSTTLHERYSSPPTGAARRRLFVDTEMTSDPPAPTRVSQPSLVSTIPAGQTVVTMATATVTANNGQTVTIPVQGAVN